MLGLAVVGGIIALVRQKARFRSYEDLVADARQISKALKGEVFRDGEDLVVSGNQGGWPVVVRFSYSETTPGLDIRMEAPASFTLWVGSKAAGSSEGRAQLRIPDAMFEARFSARSDHPTRANMLLVSKSALAALQKLCCSANAYVAINAGMIELREVVTPRPYTARHVLEHVAAMARIADFLKSMPGAEQFKIKPMRRERHIVGRLAIAAGMLAAIVTVVAATKNPAAQKFEVSLPNVPQGMLPVDAVKIPGAAGWRVATAEDFDPNAAAWLRGQGIAPGGRVGGDFSGKGDLRDVAYVLIAGDGSRRLVLLAGGVDRYDVKYPFIGLIARVPRGAVNAIQWVGKAPAQPDGDGLLIVRKPDDPASGLVLFLSGTRMLSGVPVNYQSISLD